MRRPMPTAKRTVTPGSNGERAEFYLPKEARLENGSLLQEV